MLEPRRHKHSKDRLMPTRTAPTVDGTPTAKHVSIKMIDSVGDTRSVSVYATAAATNAEVEALVAATQAATNASIAEVTVSDVYLGAIAKSNADEDVFNNIGDNIIYHVKASPTQSQRAYIPAPLESVMTDGTEMPDPDNALLVTWFGAVLAVVGGNYVGVTVRFNERRDLNDAVKF